MHTTMWLNRLRRTETLLDLTNETGLLQWRLWLDFIDKEWLLQWVCNYLIFFWLVSTCTTVIVVTVTDSMASYGLTHSRSMTDWPTDIVFALCLLQQCFVLVALLVNCFVMLYYSIGCLVCFNSVIITIVVTLCYVLLCFLCFSWFWFGFSLLFSCLIGLAWLLHVFPFFDLTLCYNEAAS